MNHLVAKYSCLFLTELTTAIAFLFVPITLNTYAGPRTHTVINQPNLNIHEPEYIDQLIIKLTTSNYRHSCVFIINCGYLWIARRFDNEHSDIERAKLWYRRYFSISLTAEFIGEAELSLKAFFILDYFLFRPWLQRSVMHQRLPTRVFSNAQRRTDTWRVRSPETRFRQRSGYKRILQQSIKSQSERRPVDGLLQHEMQRILCNARWYHRSRWQRVDKCGRPVHLTHLQQRHRLESHVGMFWITVFARTLHSDTWQVLSHLRLRMGFILSRRRWLRYSMSAWFCGGFKARLWFMQMCKKADTRFVYVTTGHLTESASPEWWRTTTNSSLLFLSWPNRRRCNEKSSPWHNRGKLCNSCGVPCRHCLVFPSESLQKSSTVELHKLIIGIGRWKKWREVILGKTSLN